MLKKVSQQKTAADGARFAIVASKYNQEYVDAMLHAAREVLQAEADEEVDGCGEEQDRRVEPG